MSESPAVELVDVVKKFGEITAVNRVSLEIRDGEFFSLLGPSGCGKTTTLRLIAGFETPSEGEVWIGGEPQGYRPAFRRPVNTVFQHYALFPHLSVFKNVAFGLEMQNLPETEIRNRVQEALAMVHLEKFDSRRPKMLSGGQQQRVALARALVNRPKVLLLDEPLGALDLKLRKSMQVELKELQDRVGITFVYVTHDQEEALTMSDRIGVMSRGHLLQVGTAQEIYETPQSRFVADFIGETNYLSGTTVSSDDRNLRIRLAGDTVVRTRASKAITAGDRVSVAIRPEKIIINPESSTEVNRIEGCGVEDLVYTGSATTYYIRIPGDERIMARVQNSDVERARLLQPGEVIAIGWFSEVSQSFKD